MASKCNSYSCCQMTMSSDSVINPPKVLHVTDSLDACLDFLDDYILDLVTESAADSIKDDVDILLDINFSWDAYPNEYPDGILLKTTRSDVTLPLYDFLCIVPSNAIASLYDYFYTVPSKTAAFNERV